MLTPKVFKTFQVLYWYQNNTLKFSFIFLCPDLTPICIWPKMNLWYIVVSTAWFVIFLLSEETWLHTVLQPPLMALDGMCKIYIHFKKFLDFHGYYWDGNLTWKFPVDGFPSTDGKVATLCIKCCPVAAKSKKIKYF